MLAFYASVLQYHVYFFTHYSILSIYVYAPQYLTIYVYALQYPDYLRLRTAVSIVVVAIIAVVTVDVVTQIHWKKTHTHTKA